MLFKSGSDSLLVAGEPEAYPVAKSKTMDPHELRTLEGPATHRGAVAVGPTPSVLEGSFLCFRA